MSIADDIARRVLSEELEGYDRALLAGDQNYDLLTERIAELELALEDIGWIALGGEAMDEFSRDGLTRITRLGRIFYLKNPLVKRGVDVQTQYVWGQGMTIKAADEDINAEIQAFLDNETNRAEVTGKQAQMVKERELQTDGNLFFVLFTNEASGQVRVRSIPFGEIAKVIHNPEDSKEPWYYERSYTREEWDLDSGAFTHKVVTEYFPDWKYHPITKRTTINHKPVHWDRPVYHVKVGGFSNWTFGVSEVYAAIDWARAYKEFLEDWASITRAYRRFAFKMTGMKSAGEIAAVKGKLDSTYAKPGAETVPPPLTGSVAFMTEGRDLEPVRTAGATVSMEDGRRLMLQVCAAQGLPETFYGDVSVGTLATAKSLNRPTELMMLSRQTLWADIYSELLTYMLMQQVKATGGALRGKGIVEVEEEDGKSEYTLVWNEDVEAKIDIDFPPIVEHDIDKLIGSIVDAATLKGFGLAGTLDMKNLVRMLLVALGEEDVDETLDLMFPEDGEEIGWEEEAAQAVAGEFREAVERLFRRLR